MCRRKQDTLASQPTVSSRSPLSSSTSSFAAAALSVTNTSSAAATATTSSSSSSSLSASSIASLRRSLPEKPTLFSFAEIAAATNNFLTNRISSSWRCTLRGRDSLVCPRAFRGDPALLPARLSAVRNSHHRSIAKLLGASLSADRIYLVYHHVAGASLADCLRSTRNPSFTPLSSWLSRMQVAADLAQGLEYIHHHSAAAGGIVHSRIKSSAVLVTEPHFNAVICHFAAAFLAGDVPETSNSVKAMNRLDSRSKKIEGTRGYLAPEVIAGGDASRGSDVYAFGVLVLELISGEVPVKFVFDAASKEYRSSSLIEVAREVFGGLGGEEEEEGRGMRIRRWVDGRMKDSFPVEVAEKMIGIALRCVEEEAEKRPSMTWVQGKVSKFFLKSRVWAETVKAPADISVSLAPR